MNAMTAQHPLLARLVEDYAYPRLTRDNLAAFSDQPGDSVILCAGDPAQHPEALDLAVVLPELAQAFPGAFRVGVADRALEPDLQARYGLTVWPSLLFLRDGGYVGVLPGIQDWAVYLKRVPELLATPAGRPPSVGIPVSAGGSHSPCHP